MCGGLLYDAFMASFETAGLATWRASLLRDLRGDVVEMGAGTGSNLPHYDPDVRLTLVEPSPMMRARLVGRAGNAHVVDGYAESTDLPAASADAVVFGLVLCSVRDPGAALAEARRLLRPGGRIVFVEHVGGAGLLGTLHRAVQPVWGVLAGGCHLDRNTEQTFVDGGFAFERIERRWMPLVPGLIPMIGGVAVAR